MNAVEALAKRYEDLLEKPQHFIDYAQRPTRSVAWRNPLAVSRQTLEEWFARYCPTAERLAWTRDAWRLPLESKPGRWPIYLSGWIHVQDETSLLAGRMLGAKPGERIIDLCAAPGGKSVIAATMMEDCGTLVANEMSGTRIVALRRAFERLQITCGAVAHGDALQYPLQPGEFDRVIADVPCTCEGTSRKQRIRHPDASDQFRASINQMQKAILRRALQLCAVGGTVLYATCTYSPEENEMVIQAAQTVADFEVLPIAKLDGVKWSTGEMQWGGKTFRPDLKNAIRLWPHQNDSGGFFFACLRKI